MITEQQIDEAYILMLSGAVDWKRDGVGKNEIKCRDSCGDFTIEFVDGGVEWVVERWYGSVWKLGEISYKNKAPYRQKGITGVGEVKYYEMDNVRGLFVRCEPFDSLFG